MPNVYQSVLSGGGGVIPSDITPSDVSPTAMSANGVYRATAAGYAIESYQEVTPSAEGASFNTGIVKMSSGGYAYDAKQGYTDYSNTLADVSTASTTHTISDRNGNYLLCLLFYQAGSATAYNRLDGATCSGGTIEKITNLRNANGNAYGTFYLVHPSSDSCVITAPYSCFAQVFEAS